MNKDKTSQKSFERGVRKLERDQVTRTSVVTLVREGPPGGRKQKPHFCGLKRDRRGGGNGVFEVLKGRSKAWGLEEAFLLFPSLAQD